MLDNVTIDHQGRILMDEDPGQRGPRCENLAVWHRHRGIYRGRASTIPSF